MEYVYQCMHPRGGRGAESRSRREEGGGRRGGGEEGRESSTVRAALRKCAPNFTLRLSSNAGGLHNDRGILGECGGEASY